MTAFTPVITDILRGGPRVTLCKLNFKNNYYAFGFTSCSDRDGEGLLSSRGYGCGCARTETARCRLFAIAALCIVSAGGSTPLIRKSGSGLIVDTTAAQLYDRLLDVDLPLSVLVPEAGEAGKCWITGRLVPFSPARRDVFLSKNSWFYADPKTQC